MTKFLSPARIFVWLFFGSALVALNAAASEKLVELRLVDEMDEPRGYCLDIAGGRGANAPLDRGMQAHTCYDYTGGLLEDQAFDAALISEGQFKIVHFDICMAVSALDVGAAIELAPCDQSDVQKFSLQSDGRLSMAAKPDLCITVNDTQKREGRGGTPVHVMRPVSLQPCSDDAKALQSWKMFSL